MSTVPTDPNIANTQDIPVSEPINMPPSEPEAPRNEDAPLGAKDVNEPISTPIEDKPLEPVSPISEAKVEPEQAIFPEPSEVLKVSEPQTAQTPGSGSLSVSKPSQKDLWQKFLAKIQIGKRKKLEKIMTLFLKKKNITNDEVEKYLHISDATATRYLNILEKENKIKQTGKTGKSVFYIKI